MLNASEKALGNTYNLMSMCSQPTRTTSLFTDAEDGDTCDFSFGPNTEQYPVSLLMVVSQSITQNMLFLVSQICMFVYLCIQQTPMIVV